MGLLEADVALPVIKTRERIKEAVGWYRGI